jgi:phosphoribosylformylglycinamidine synthase
MDVLEAPRISPETVAEHGLSDDEYQRILKALGREPNLVELGIFSVMWSEHCSYKSSRLHLKKLPTEAPWVICGPGENAGVIDIGDGDAAIFKMESHNHPSYIEPYQGAATGVGGILRDVFTMGARPIANLNALRFGRPDHPKMKHLIAGVVHGIGGYGNCVGVPTVGGEVNFDEAYDGNILVNAMTVGVAKQDKVFYSAATGIGNPIVYVGSKTGRDGIHGATMASADFDENSDEKRPTVQVGDPFTEKLLIEACLELMATDAIVAIQDMGAAGLTSSSVEMASKGGAGIRLDMNKVPCREEGMTPYEMMLSESQERMLMVLKPGREPEAEKIFRKWELDFAVIGEVTDTGHMVLEWNGEVVCDIPLDPLADEAPLYDRPHLSLDEYKAWAQVKPLEDVPDSTDIAADLLKLIGSPALASRRWIWEQYDQSVGGDTVQRPGGDAAVVRVHGTRKALAMTTDCTPRYCYADPYEGGKQAIAEAYRNLCSVGARPLAVTNCLNFGNPQRPEIMAQFVECLRGMGDAWRKDGPPPPVDLDTERRTADFVREQISLGALTAVHDVADGGLAVAFAEMALAGNIGALIQPAGPGHTAKQFFAEDQGLYVATVDDAFLLDVLTGADAAGVQIEPIGRTAGQRLIFELADGDFCVTLAELRAAHEGFFPKLMGADAALA